MTRVGDITGERRDVRDGRELVSHATQTFGIACRQDEIPPARCESSRQREAESA
jgi:hypothetical protein